MRKSIILLLCVLAVFAIVSCKNEPQKPADPVVTFDTQGGSAIAAVTVAKDALLPEPEAPEKDGYVFYTWFTESTFENIYDFTTPVTESFTLYAKWVPGPADEVETYKIVAAKENDRFQYQWIFTDAIKAGDEISFKYKSTRVIDEYTTRSMSKKNTDTGKLASSVAITDPVQDEDGWYTFTFTVPATKTDSSALASSDIGIGVALYFADLVEDETTYTKTRVGIDYIYIKDVTYKTASETRNLTMTDDNVYYGAEGTVEKSFIRMVATLGGAPEGDTHNYSQDKFRLTWEDDVEINEGDVFTMVYKVKRTDPLTKDRSFQFSLRNASVSRWLYEADPGTAYPAYWSTMSEPDLDGWITVTYVFPAADAEGLPKGPVSYPSPFVVDFRDEYFASPAEGRIADIVYLRSATITTKDPDDPLKTITTPLVLDEDETSMQYSCPEIEDFFFPDAE